MIVGQDIPSRTAEYNRTAATRNHHASTASQAKGSALVADSIYGDSVYISDEARALQAGTNLQSMPDGLLESGGQIANAAKGTALQRYLGTAHTDLTALNHSRKSIGARIDSIIKGLGIKLGKDEKISLTVDSKNQLSVSGIKDKARAKKIEEALNEDLNLGRDMRKLSVSGKLGEYAKQADNYRKDYAAFSDAIGQDVEDAFTSPGMRSFVIEEYLQDKAGVSLTELSLEKGADGTTSILGQSSALNAMLEEDPTLGATITDILEKGEVDSGFKATFEFANGALSDSTTMDEAKKKIGKIETYLLGGVDPDTGEVVNGMLSDALKNIQNNGGDVDEELAKALSRGFRLRVAANGEFEIMGLDKLEPKYKQMLEGIVQGALNNAANQPGQINNFSDVAAAYIEQHQFEHGDTLEYAHMVDINIGGGSHTTKVVSPDADQAQDAANQETAGKLGEKLKGMMSEKGIDVTGMELEIDDSGKITVTGEANEAEITKAQAFVDQFVQDAGAQGKEADKAAREEEEEATDEVESKRREEIYGGSGDDGDAVPEGFAARDVVASANSAEMKERAWREELTEQVRHLLPDPTLQDEKSRMDLERFLSWQEYMPGNKEEPNLKNYSSFAVSEVDGPLFGGRVEREFADEAVRLYHELMGGMKNFHEERKNVRYVMNPAAAAAAEAA